LNSTSLRPGRPDQSVADSGRRAAAALGRCDVLRCTSRTLVRDRDAAGTLAIARTVSVALSRTIRRRGDRPAVARVISVFRPIDAAPQAIGMPYIVFAGTSAATGPKPRSWTSSMDTSKTHGTCCTAVRRQAGHDA
jgi:hypothetical protein